MRISCFQCGDGKRELVMCDRKDCPKSPHLLCLNLPQPPYGERPRGPCSGCREDKWPEQAALGVQGDARGQQGWGLMFPEVGSWAPVVWSWGRAHSHAARTTQTSRAEAWSCGQPDAASSWRGRWEAGCLAAVDSVGTHWVPSFFLPPQESGSAPGTSATSAVLRPSLLRVLPPVLL